ncbi:MAG: tetratricopeptide repeat protein [Nitrospira sp.]
MIRDSLYSIVVMCVLAASLAGTSLAQSEEPDSNPFPQSEVSASSSSTEAPRIPVLPPEVLTEVEGIEHQVDAVFNRGEDRSPEDLQSLIQAAERAVLLRTQHQGKTWWETITAQNNLQDIRTWVTLSAESRAAWREASALHEQVNELRRKGKDAEALPLAQQALAILEKLLGPAHPDTAYSLNKLGMLYYSQGQYAQAQLLYERALAIRKTILGPNHPSTAKSLNNLATIHEAQRRYAEAQPLYERALAIREKVRGPNHPDTAKSLNNLALFYTTQGQYAQAQPLHERALAIWEKVLGPDHLDTATSLHNLASLHEAQGQYVKALPLYERALAIRKTVLGPEHPDTVTSLGSLAGVHTSQGQYTQAQPLYERVLAIREKTLGPEHPDTATSLNNLAVLYKMQGQYAHAMPLYERALAIAEKVLGPDHLDTATRLNNLAALHHTQGQYGQAQPLYARAIAIQEKVLGPDHLDTATSLNNLGLLYRAQGQYAKAQPFSVRALRIFERALGPDHPKTATSLNNLVALYEAQGQYHQAQPLCERVLAITEKVLGPDHPHTAMSLNNLALLYQDQEQYAKALPLFQRALAITEHALGSDHLDTATCLNNLAGLYKEQAQYSLAFPLSQRVLAIKEKVLGPDHPDMAMSFNNLASLYEAQGQYAQAQPLYKKVLAIREKVLGINHPDTATSLNNLAGLYQTQGQYSQAQSLYEQALAIAENVLGPDHPDTAGSLTNLAALYETRGAYAQAQPLSLRALGIVEQALGPDHPNTATSLNGLAGLYHSQGQYTQAQPLYERALAIRKKVLGLDHPSTATSFNDLASLYDAQGRYTEAQPLHEQALAIKEKVLGPEHSDTARSLNNLALSHNEQGNYAAALPLLQRALRIQEKSLGPNHPDTATTLNNLALTYEGQGQYAQALPLYERALVIMEKVLGPDHLDTAIQFENLAIAKMDLQADKEVAQLFLQASQAKWQSLTRTFPTLSTPAQQQFLTMSALRITTQLFWPLFTALPTLDRAMGFQATLLSKQLVAEASRHESSALRQVLTNAPPAWRTLWQQREDLRRQYATRALQDLQHDPTRPRRAAQQSANDSISPRLLSDQIDQLEQQLRRDHPAYAAAAQLEQISVEQVRAALRPQDLLLEYVQFRSYDPQTKKLTDTQHYGVYVVRGDRSPIVALDLGDAAPIDAAIQQYHDGQREVRDLVNSGETPKLRVLQQSEATLAGLSSRIRTAIWQPLDPHLRGVTRVYVAPDGQLSQLPFEVLAQQTKKHNTKQQWTYLVEEKELVYLNTGRDLARLAATTGATNPSTSASKQAVLIGNPAFYALPPDVARAIAALPASTPPVVAQHDPSGKPATLGLAETSPRLEVPRRWADRPELGTLLHASNNQLTRHGWTVTMLEQQQAVEEAVLRVQAPQLLQLATHGYRLDPAPDAQRWDNPLLRSMLLFSGVNQADPQQSIFYRLGQDLLSETEARKRGLSDEARQTSRIEIGDGILTAYEVTGMNLQGTELVNLTACETGLGQVTSDGVLGLRQAFLLAGARALTLSMWEVPAKETTKQIEAFYQRWLGTAKDSKKNSNNKKHMKSPTALTRYGAFRQTQLAALDAARAHRKGVGHPFFWAGTIYLGDPGDLHTQVRSIEK